MTTQAQAAPLRAFVLEPFELAVSQPHQFLISSASVSIVAMEAASLVPWPFNIGLAIGAEWAYLRGFITGAGVKTRWASALNWAAVALVFGYGTLWGLRSFHLIPDAPAPWLAVLLTIIHIGAIGAVTICSAMLHRVVMDAQAAAQQAARARADERAASDEQARRDREAAELAYQDEQRRARDAMQLELERQWKEAQIKEASARVRAELRASVRAQSPPSASGTTTNTLTNTEREPSANRSREHFAHSPPRTNPNSRGRLASAARSSTS